MRRIPKTHNQPKVPANLLPFVEEIGEDAAEQLFLRLGGAPAYFAHNAQQGMAVQTIGAENVTKLARRLGSGMHRIPQARHWLIDRMSKRGLSGYEIARRLGISERTVRSTLNRAHDDEERQRDMFPA